MSSYELRWEIAGELQLGRRFSRLALDLRDFREPLGDMADLIYAENRQQFAAEGRPSWPKLSTGYQRWKDRHFPGAKIMHRTGKLERSLTDRKATGAVFRLTNDLLEVGSGLKVGRYNLGLIHQKPVTARVPQRRTMVLTKTAQTQATMIFADWFDRKGREAGVGK